MPVSNLALFDSSSAYTNFDAAGYTLYITTGSGSFNEITNLLNADGFTKASCNVATDFKTKRDAVGLTTYNLEARKQKLYQIIYDILTLSDYNLMGELKVKYFQYAL